MAELVRLLVTGATGKVGRALVDRLQGTCEIRALCHNRSLDVDGVESVFGSIADRDAVRQAMAGVTHVVHLATCKETPDEIMDVAVKGLFWLLEEARESPAFERFVLIGGDAAVGHFVYKHPVPVTETQRHTAYEGCYALSKVLEEVMLEQYQIAYGLNSTCLRAPWIMDRDDFRYSLSFGTDQFGGPPWRELVDGDVPEGAVPLALDADGHPLKRNFVHVSDLVEAIAIALEHPAALGQTFNICMDEPVDYQQVADHLASTRGLPAVKVPTPHHSTWLDNAKAKLLLGWKPKYDTERLIDEAWDYQRSPDDPRIVWYPG
ncbi:NAD-dependent epimerase/dehydratase family protein [Actinopolymorpha singaporensis]|uniref:NAD-dependent epimerase/dehydratase family protein n=1 Tax=Actinopolymorpha singaporensis TaxID=117157 RepID=UPI0018D4C2FD|nr:NAD(P)-dependent oxidoreductase [Actinopolymorpha singaporensis]